MSKYTRISGLFFSICSLYYPAQGRAPAPAHSPEAYTDLICHTSHASECYPAIFQPTEHFQLIHDDQSIPPGLHIRLNLATGLKEARLNVPEPDDAPKADLVLLDNPPSPGTEEQNPLIPDLPNHNDPLSHPDNNDNFETPLPFLPSEDTDMFQFYKENALQIFDLSTDSLKETDAQESLTALTEYAHSQEWGQAITSDPSLTHIFVDFVDLKSAAPTYIQSAAAQLLGTAIQNNPEALSALLAQFKRSPDPESWPIHVVHAALRDEAAKEPTAQNTLLQKRLLFLLSQLCHDSTERQLQIFVSSSGLRTLFALFESDYIAPDDGRVVVRTKIANFLLDHILPAIADWEDDPFFKLTPPDVSIQMTAKRATWSNAISKMGPWCSAFGKAIEVYGDDRQSDESLKAYQSISEAYELSDQVLSRNGCAGGCKCDFSKASTQFGNEEL